MVQFFSPFTLYIILVAYIIEGSMIRKLDQLENGSGGCPCINPWNNETITSESSEGYPCREVTLGSGVTKCVSLDYGAYICKDWTLIPGGSTGNFKDADEISSSKWCFVDVDNCDRPHYPSQIIGDKMSISYETCGNIRTYDEDVYTYKLRDKTLRVGLPGVYSYNGTSYDYNFPEGEESLDPQGSIIEFFKDIALEAGFNFTYHTRSNASTTLYPSSTYSACVHDVAIGYVDMCIGPFWALPSRIMQTPMTSSFFKDEFYLVVPSFVANGNSFWETITTPLRPFSNAAWLAIAFVFVYVSTTLLLMTMKHDYRENKVVNTFRNFGGHVAYNTILNFTLGINAELFMSERGHASFQRLVIVGSAIFGLLIKSLYVSSLAASFVLNQKVVSKYNSLEDIVNDGGVVCVDKLVASSFQSAYEHILREGSIEALPQNEHIALTDADLRTKANLNARCSSILILEDAFNSYRSRGQFCSAELIDRPMISLGVTFPVSEMIDDEMNYLISKEVIAGSYDNLRRKYQGIYQRDICSLDLMDHTEAKERSHQLSLTSNSDPHASERSLSSSSSDTKVFNEKKNNSGIGLLELLGPITIALGLTTLGLGLFLWDIYIKPYLTDKQTQKFSKEKGASPTFQSLGADVTLKRKLHAMSAFELIEKLSLLNTDFDPLDLACKSLPDTSALVALAFELECSDTTKNLLHLEELSIFELFKLARKHVDINSLKAALQDEAPKTKLIKLLSEEYDSIKNEICREQNWDAIKAKKNQNARLTETSKCSGVIPRSSNTELIINAGV